MRCCPLLPSPPLPGGSGADVVAAGRAPGYVDIDPQLLARAQAYLAGCGDARTEPRLREAWEGLFAILAPMVHARARARRRAGIDPDDAEQEAWAALVSRIPAYRPDPARGPFLAWVATTARHAQTNAARRRGGRLPGPPSRPEAVPSDPAEAIEHAELRERVRRGLVAFHAEVGTTAYWVVLLHWFANQTIDAVAARLGLTHGQVVGHINRAMPRLRAYLVCAIDPD